MTSSNPVLTTQEVADRYYELARVGQIKQIQDELYDPDAVSIEPENRSNLPRHVAGLDAMKQKEQQFYRLYDEMHGGECGQPVVSGVHFACAQSLDVTIKGQRKVKHQLGVFEVAHGKVVLEQFFYQE